MHYVMCKFRQQPRFSDVVQTSLHMQVRYKLHFVPLAPFCTALSPKWFHEGDPCQPLLQKESR